MMPDQLYDGIKNFYSNSQKKAIKSLKETFDAKLCLVGDEDFPKQLNDKYWTVYKLQVDISKNIKSLLIAIPLTFPDSIPKIYLSKSEYEIIGDLPHVDKNRFVCTRNIDVILLNENKPDEAVLKIVEIAINEILKPGIVKENLEDIQNEFLAYWREKCDQILLSIISPPNEICQLKIFSLNNSIFKAKNILTDNRQNAKNWLEAFNIDTEHLPSFNALHLPLTKSIPWPFPYSNKDLYLFFKKLEKRYLKEIKKFFRSKSNLVILFSHKCNDSNIWYGYMFENWPRTILNGYSSFRKLPLEVKVLKTSNLKLNKINIERVDKNRLQNRIGITSNNTNNSSRVCIIGCGSIGSSIAVSLAKSGLELFTLVDSDYLNAENVMRHECGMYDASTLPKKVTVLRKHLKKHFPNIICDIHDSDALELLIKNKSVFNNYDLIISATANQAFERRLNHIAYENDSYPAIAYVWIEPYGVAGNLLLINNQFKGCYNCCFNNNAQYRFAISNQNTFYNMYEAGCQTSFLPYSHLDVQQFVSVICRRLIKWFDSPQSYNFRLSWIGDKESFLSMGFTINNRWAGNQSFSTFEKQINPETGCKICSK